MDLDKYLQIDEIGGEIPPLILDQSYIEYAIIRLYMIDVMNLIKTKAILSKEFHLSATDIDKMPYWEYELWLQQLNDLVKDDNEKQQKEMDKYHIDDAMKMASPNGMRKTMDAATPKMPTMPNFGTMKAPSF